MHSIKSSNQMYGGIYTIARPKSDVYNNMTGGFSWGSLVDGIKQAIGIGKQVYDVGKQAYDIADKSGLISNVGKLVSGRGSAQIKSILNHDSKLENISNNFYDGQKEREQMKKRRDEMKAKELLKANVSASKVEAVNNKDGIKIITPTTLMNSSTGSNTMNGSAIRKILRKNNKKYIKKILGRGFAQL